MDGRRLVGVRNKQGDTGLLTLWFFSCRVVGSVRVKRRRGQWGVESVQYNEAVVPHRIWCRGEHADRLIFVSVGQVKQTDKAE